jgi:exonuclease SbcC
MNEISKITIKNFQSHSDTEIIPAPSGFLTVLVGASDQGKTSILRALRHVYYNLPTGTDFIQVGSNSSVVRIDYADGHSVTRTKSHKGLNRYEVIYPDKAPEKFEGFGLNVPLEVQTITGVRPVEIGDMTLLINLADQLQGPFLGSAVSAPARAKVLGKLAGTEEVDYAAKTAGTDLYRRRQDKERHQNDEIRLTKSIEGYAYLEELATKIQVAEILLASIKEKSERLNQLKRLQDQLMQVMENQEETIYQIAYLDGIVNVAEPILAGAAQKLDRYQRLQALNTNWEMAIGQISKVQDILDHTQHIDEAATLHAQATAKADRLTNLQNARHEYAVIGGKLANEECTLLRTQTIGEAEIILSCAVKHEARRSYLQGRREALNMVNFHLQNAQKTLDATQGIDHAILVGKTIQDNLVKLRALRNASERYDNCANAIIMQDMKLSKLAGIDEAETILDTVRAKAIKADRLQHLGMQHGAVEGEIGDCSRAIDTFTIREQSAIADYKNTLLAAGVCPVCGSEITPKILREAV